MITDVEDNFSLEKRTSNNGNNIKVQEWENLMWKYQKALPAAKKNIPITQKIKIWH